MDTEDPQRSPLQSKQERVRSRKLRMSCDACSSSKTKCDQSRPICIRCKKAGQTCNYSISQRKGKPPASSRDPSDIVNGRKSASDKQSCKPAEENLNCCALDSRQVAIESACHFDQDLSTMDISLPVFEDVMPALWQTFMPEISDYSASDFSMTSSNSVDQDFLSMDTSFIAQSNPMNLCEDIFKFEDEFPDVLDIGREQSPSQTELPIPTGPLTAPSFNDVDLLSQRYDCTRLAFSTLDSLNVDSQTCSGSSMPVSSSVESITTSFDQMLIISKSAVENAHQLLSCRCSLSQQSILILSLIIDKVLALYQTIIRQLSPSSDASAEKFVSETPITIGAYKMDAKDEQRMRLQFVSNELRKAATLVEKYADRYCNLGCQEREDKGIYTALTGRLRRRMKEAVGDIVSALRTSRV